MALSLAGTRRVRHAYPRTRRVLLATLSLTHKPYLPPTAYAPADVDYIVPRVLELVYTAWDMQPLARDLGYDGPPFAWDVERRFRLRCELDAYFLHLYGITRD